MNDPIRTFSVVDARTLDGTPYEVAEAAVVQALALVDLATEYTDIAQRMARNADDERELHLKGSDAVLDYANTAQNRNFEAAQGCLDQASDKLRPLVKAVAYNPRAKVVKG